MKSIAVHLSMLVGFANLQAQVSTGTVESAIAPLPELEVPADIRILSRPNGIGVQATSVEGKEWAYGISYYRDITTVDRCFVSFEHGEFEDNFAGLIGNTLYGTEKFKMKSNELEGGYFRRVSNIESMLGLFIGASIGVDFAEAEGETAVTDGRRVAATRTEVDLDPVVNLYANFMADAAINPNFRLFSQFSYGLNLGASGESTTYSNFAPPEVSSFDDSDKEWFWNLSVGILIPW